MGKLSIKSEATALRSDMVDGNNSEDLEVMRKMSYVDLPHHHANEPETWFTVLARWWVLLVFCMLAFAQNCAWNYFSPISDVAREVYRWSDNDIAWIENASNVTILFGIPPIAMLLDTRGLRPAVLICGFLLTLACAIRCIKTTGWSPVETETLMIVSMGLNGLGASALNFAAPSLSSSWFPPSQRATATALASVSPFIGSSVGFVLGPAVVRDVPSNWTTSSVTREDLHNDISNLYIAEVVFTGFFLLCAVVYFPSRPAVAPSTSEAVERNQAETRSPLEGLRELFIKLPIEAVRVWMVIFCFSLPLGVFNGWVAILDINLEQVGMSRSQASWLGFYMVLAGCAGGVVMGRMVDRFSKHLKTMILVLYGISTVAFGWFALAVLKLIPSPIWSVFVSGIIAGFALNCCIPLFFELILECAFPVVPAGTASGFLVIVLNAVEIIFLAIAFGVTKNTHWMNLLMFFVVPLSALILIPCKVEYKRADADKE